MGADQRRKGVLNLIPPGFQPAVVYPETLTGRCRRMFLAGGGLRVRKARTRGICAA